MALRLRGASKYNESFESSTRHSERVACCHSVGSETALLTERDRVWGHLWPAHLFWRDCKPGDLDWNVATFTAKPAGNLSGAAELSKLFKDQMNRILNTVIGIHFQAIIFGPHLASRHAGMELATLGFCKDRGLRALAERADFELAHRAF